MARGAFVSETTVDILRHIRSSSRKISQKRQTLDEVDVGIASDVAEIKALQRECEALGSKRLVQEKLAGIDRIGPHLEKLDDLKVSLTKEINDYQSDLRCLRERLEQEFWRDLISDGHPDPDDGVSSDTTPAKVEVDARGKFGSSEEHHGHIVDQNDQNRSPTDQNLSPTSQAPSTVDDPMRKAMSLLYTTKENLIAAASDFHRLDRVCEAQRRDFEEHTIPEWHDMSRTEFDLEELLHRVGRTKELIQAEKAYSEAGRLAVEVGLVREDSEQSCHFLDDASDGRFSGDRCEIFLEPKKMDSIESWRQRIETPHSETFDHGEGDDWEVDSVQFGEGCSTHADEGSKKKIVCFEDSREMARQEMSRAGVFTCADELLSHGSPVIQPQALPSATPVPVQVWTETDISTAGIWTPSLGVMKELLLSGQAVVARFSATWSSRRGNDGSFRG